MAWAEGARERGALDVVVDAESNRRRERIAVACYSARHGGALVSTGIAQIFGCVSGISSQPVKSSRDGITCQQFVSRSLIQLSLPFLRGVSAALEKRH